jgi:hypothetical protein
MPKLSYQGKGGRTFDFYTDRWGQVYCVVEDGVNVIVESPEGRIRVDSLKGFFSEVVRIEDLSELICSGDKLARFIDSKLEELSIN